MLEKILSKVLSGKFLFTIISALVFAVMSLKGLLPQDKVMEVVLIVIYAYFTKAKDGGTSDGADKQPKV